MKNSNEAEYVIMYSDSHERLGLFDDLKNDERCNLIIRKKKKYKNSVFSFFQKVLLNPQISKFLNYPNCSRLYEKLDILELKGKCVIVLDSALSTLDLKALNELCNQEDTRVVLVLINSMEASSFLMNYVRKVYKDINWSDIYSFDNIDASKYGFKSIEYSYYSKQNITCNVLPENDAYFVGWLKGNRTGLLTNLVRKLYNENCKIDFNISVPRSENMNQLEFKDVIKYSNGKWIPYEKVIEGINNSNVIVEILQDGQNGPSLRYYEAVCYNKKLLTNNKNIVNFPYYNSAYMKIIEDDNCEISIDWIKKREDIDYNYKGDFSPVNMLSVVLE